MGPVVERSRRGSSKRQLSEGDTVLQQLIENCHEDLTPLEWAKGIARAMEAKKMTARQAASELGFSETRVSNSLVLLKLPEWIQKLVEEGRIAGRRRADWPGSKTLRSRPSMRGN